MTSPYLSLPLRSLSEAEAQRAELRRTVRNCDVVFALAAGSSPDRKTLLLGALRAAQAAVQRGDMMRAEMCIGHAGQMAEDMIEESGE